MIEIKINKKLNHFLIKLHKNNIEVLKINGNKIFIKKSDLKKLEQLITIYDVEIIGPIINLKKLNKFFMFSIFFSICLVIFLSNIIFEINIITENQEIKELISNELKKNNIKKYKFKKDNLIKISENIISRNKKHIEWLYIEEVGTTYNVKVQIRELKENKLDNKPSNLISSKNAIIKKLNIIQGEIIKGENQYVKKGDIIVSGDIKLNDNIVGKTKSIGKIYGEVWYKSKVNQPLIIYKKINDNNLNVNFYFLGNTINIIGKKDNFKINKLLPFGLQISKSNSYEINTILNYEQAKKIALDKTYKEINSKLNDNEYIIHSHILKERLIDSKMELDIFYTVYEDITKEQLIE